MAMSIERRRKVLGIGLPLVTIGMVAAIGAVAPKTTPSANVASKPAAAPAASSTAVSAPKPAPTHSSAAPSPSDTSTWPPGSVGWGCDHQHWPQPMPALTGLAYDLTGKASDLLQCLNVTQAVAPDGHNVLTDPAKDVGARGYVIAAATPNAGTLVAEHTPISLALRLPAGSTSTTSASTGGSSSGTTSGTTGGTTSGTSGGSGGGGATGGSSGGAVVDPGNGPTAKCKDGTLSNSAHHQGTCSHHGGVAIWYK